MPRRWPNDRQQMWKYAATWVMTAVFCAMRSLAEVHPAATTDDPITAGYNGAQLISQLTDRGLWLFFLFIILGYGYLNDRRKEREISRLQGKIDEIDEEKWKLLTSNERLLQRIERKLDE